MNIDSLLDLLTKTVWVLFFLFSGLIAIREFRERGFRPAILRLLTFRTLSLLLLAIALTLLSAAVVCT
jgi:hypothetical protein